MYRVSLPPLCLLLVACATSSTLPAGVSVTPGAPSPLIFRQPNDVEPSMVIFRDGQLQVGESIVGRFSNELQFSNTEGAAVAQLLASGEVQLPSGELLADVAIAPDGTARVLGRLVRVDAEGMVWVDGASVVRVEGLTSADHRLAVFALVLLAEQLVVPEGELPEPYEAGSVVQTNSPGMPDWPQDAQAPEPAQGDVLPAGRGDYLGAMMQQRATQFAAGMQPATQLVRAALQNGGTRQFRLSIEHGKCFKVIGVGGITVVDFNLRLQDDGGRTVDSDTERDNYPVLGVQRPLCTVSGGTYSVEARMRNGSGEFALQVFTQPM